MARGSARHWRSTDSVDRKGALPACGTVMVAGRPSDLATHQERRRRNLTVATRPPPVRFASVTSPPCARISVRAMLRPRPAPPVSALRDASILTNGSNTSSRCSPAMPGPGSSTVTTESPARASSRAVPCRPRRNAARSARGCRTRDAAPWDAPSRRAAGAPRSAPCPRRPTRGSSALRQGRPSRTPRPVPRCGRRRGARRPSRAVAERCNHGIALGGIVDHLRTDAQRHDGGAQVVADGGDGPCPLSVEAWDARLHGVERLGRAADLARSAHPHGGAAITVASAFGGVGEGSDRPRHPAYEEDAHGKDRDEGQASVVTTVRPITGPVPVRRGMRAFNQVPSVRASDTRRV